MTRNERSVDRSLALRAAALCALWLAFAAPAGAQQRADPANVVLAAPLHEAASKDAQVIANLSAGESVSVLQMSGAYSRVRAATGEGWVLSSRLQIGDPAPAGATGGSAGTSWVRGLSGLLTGSSGTSSGSSGNVPIGIRGLQREDVANAQPDQAGVDRLERYALSVAEAQAQARAAGLQSIDMAYLDAAVGAAPASGGSARQREVK